MKKKFVVLILLFVSIILISGCAEKECKTDILKGYQQPIITKGNKIENLIVRDYPLII